MTNEYVTFDKSSLCTQLFRSAVKEVLPISVQGKLRDIPGLDEMDHDQWSETETLLKLTRKQKLLWKNRAERSLES